MWFALTPAPLLLTCRTADASFLFWGSLAAACCTSLAFLGLALLCERSPRMAKGAGFLALFGCGVAGFPSLASDPLFALLGGVVLIQLGYFLLEPSPPGMLAGRRSSRLALHHKTRYSLLAVVGTALLAFPLNPHHHPLGEQAISASVLISQILVAHWLWTSLKGTKRLWGLLVPLLAAGLSLMGLVLSLTGLAALTIALLCLWFLPCERHGLIEHPDQWWEIFLNHPARVLISSFFGLCLVGTLLLQLPWVATDAPVTVINAAFTSVSAVCVTGLTVLDTAIDFTPLGQGCILVLIQLGGLGIMTITTVALHALGKRLSLRQERLLTTLTETSHQELVRSLVTIVRFTLFCELTGALLLTMGFQQTGVPWAQALWRGVFTSVSAFCNAGFALESTNLVPYQHTPLILHIVAVLIVLGGLAPATSLLIPRLVRGHRIDLAPRLALVTTAVLLLVGTGFFVLFEWNHALAGLSFPDKLHNAWFQSVTLRTAGFNTIDLGNVLSPTLLVMLGWMFIGGSPGGTAGGVKTTTIAVLALTFWASITGKESVIVQNRQIPQTTINRAVTVFLAGGSVWFTVVLALMLTQSLPSRQLIFEATSALGTVGLSLGTTPQLDNIGKIIIMLAMFIGRIGPITLFTLLSADHPGTDSGCPEARITLT